MEESAFWWYAARREIVEEIFVKHAKHTRNLRILDIGCGMGGELPQLEAYGEVRAVDPENRAVAFTKARAMRPDLVEVGQLPYEINLDEPFDCVVALDVLEHIDEDVESPDLIYEKLLEA